MGVGDLGVGDLGGAKGDLGESDLGEGRGEGDWARAILGTPPATLLESYMRCKKATCVPPTRSFSGFDRKMFYINGLKLFIDSDLPQMSPILTGEDSDRSSDFPASAQIPGA
jgi:hypothetical protein